MVNNDIPEQLAVMALPGTILFPSALLPLYIFEPRYREMLARALSEERMFAIGMLSGDGDDEPVFEIGGAGLIRACVQNPDGTAHLVLQGVQRVRFVDWVTVQPYRIARVVPLESTNQQADEAAKLAGLLRVLCNDLTDQGYALPPQFHTYLDQFDNPEALGDLISSALIPDPILRQSLLQELDVPMRLKGLISSLKAHLKDG
jgi:Lon protease-like protein